MFFYNIRLGLFSKSTFCETRKRLICFLLRPNAFLLVRGRIILKKKHLLNLHNLRAVNVSRRLCRFSRFI